MDQVQKIRVAVLYGGRSGEHEVSLASAANVIQNLDRARFDVVSIGIDKKGSWFIGDDFFKKELTESATPLKLQCDTERMLFNPECIQKPLASSQLLMAQSQAGRLFDVVFPVVHGPLCEDGTVQGLLELANVPYVGCGVLSSAIGMDKDVSKRLVQQAGISVPAFISIKIEQWTQSPSAFCERVLAQLSFPLFVKPANTGSSVGVSKVKSIQELQTAIDYAFLYDTKVIIEQGIVGRELEIAVLQSLENQAFPITSVVGEIKPADVYGYYSYASKYVDDKGAELIVPALLSEELQNKIRQVAQAIFLALECEGMARVDLFLEQDTQIIYFNEINTIPGFTQISMYPKLLSASGISYTELLTQLVLLAMDRHAKRSKLSREYIKLK